MSNRETQRLSSNYNCGPMGETVTDDNEDRDSLVDSGISCLCPCGECFDINLCEAVHNEFSDSEDEIDADPPPIKRSVSLSLETGILEAELTMIQTPNAVVQSNEKHRSRSAQDRYMYFHGNTVVLLPCFSDPRLSTNFLDRLHRQKVCLDSMQITGMTVRGYIRAVGIPGDIEVVIQYSDDRWLSSRRLPAESIPVGTYDGTELFAFQLNTSRLGQRIEFVVKMCCGDEEYWDNNFQTNYVLYK